MPWLTKSVPCSDGQRYRDYVDVDAILTSGRYAEDELLDLAADHDPGFDQSWFAEALAAIDRLPDSPVPAVRHEPEGHSGTQGTDARMGPEDQHRRIDRPNFQ
jgi:hypothetical protein